ncbi:M4 family metallopeptidase [Nostoc sp. WHI]|uniref:M4 family metallopeptidase n=1 Tax=Nostoc sp. WHI TaxID=2650611 RepID=UPI0018C76824|nr:M4 family metallopeptidase [Nostoc sp. WHI]MBG1265487.1 M4 family metallopeptidase [Nostoc sp. WHI]
MQIDCSIDSKKDFNCPYKDNFNCPYDTQEEIRVDDQQLVIIFTLAGNTIDIKDTEHSKQYLPGKPVSYPIKNSSQCQQQCVQARSYVTEVAEFIQNISRDTGLGDHVASINWQSDNALWVKPLTDNSPMQGQAIFGQVTVNQQLLSYASIRNIVAHEFFHGLNYITTVNSSTKRGIEYKGESGAVDESYADIFAILFSNYAQSDIGQWDWEIGKGIGKEGKPIRDISNPSKYGQLKHMNDYRYYLPGEKAIQDNDYLGVHDNCGILSKAAYNLITSKNSSGQYVFDVQTIVQIFYQSLNQLAETPLFNDCYVAVKQSAYTQFYQDKSLTKEQIKEKIKAIDKAYNQVGIYEVTPTRLKKIFLTIKQTRTRFVNWLKKLRD